MQTKAFRIIEELEKYGNNVREPYSKCLKEGVFELRIQTAGNAARILYFFVTGKKIILTNGFIKKTQKTPDGEITRALTYKADYERRNK